jgi:hypothetical protein
MITCHFNDFRDPNPHVKLLGPNFKFLTNRIGLLVYSVFKLDLGPRVNRALGFEWRERRLSGEAMAVAVGARGS